MHLTMLLQMAADGYAERIAFGSREHGGVSYSALQARAARGAEQIREHGAARLLYVGTNDVNFPVALFAAALAGVPFIPLNYRLGEAQLHELLAEQEAPLVIADEQSLPRVAGVVDGVLAREEWQRRCVEVGDGVAAPADLDGESVALLLYTSGTTAKPKAAVLRHRHLAAYVLGSVEFAAASEDDATLVSVPPYHIAGVANVLSNIYSGRRVVQLPQFDPQEWLVIARREQVTHALVVPTMLGRIVEALDAQGAAQADVPTLRTLAYGGARMPQRVIERALELFPHTNFVNAYGLTETSSTIAVLGPEDHRAAVASDDPAIRARLTSAGRLLPGVEAQVRAPQGEVLDAGEIGELFLRGPQISGEYAGKGSACDEEGWFPTRDRGWIDADGYLFIEGRADDTIIRGGENIAPAEIEDVLMQHPAVLEAAVVGLPDEHWGQCIGAVITVRSGQQADPDELRAWARERLRASKTPEVVEIWEELPRTETGKLVRRDILDQLAEPATRS